MHLLEEEDEYYPSVPVRWIPDLERFELEEIPAVEDPAPSPELDPGLTDDPIVENPAPAAPPSTNAPVGIPSLSGMTEDEYQEIADRRRRARVFGICVIVAGVMALIGAGVVFRRRRSDGEEKADGFTEEGPPPLE